MLEARKTVVETHNVKSYNYYISFPKIKSDKKLPLIVFLHGVGERGDDVEKVKIHGIPKLFEVDNDYECITVSPQCPGDSIWPAELQTLKQFIDEIVKEYNIDTNRIYLTGLSMGGYGTWHMAMTYPNFFAAIAPVCGGGLPWYANVLKMPVWAFHGEVDSVVSVEESKNMVREVNNAGGNAKLTIFENVDHDSWNYAYNDELIKWLLEQSK